MTDTICIALSLGDTRRAAAPLHDLIQGICDGPQNGNRREAESMMTTTLTDAGRLDSPSRPVGRHRRPNGSHTSAPSLFTRTYDSGRFLSTTPQPMQAAQ